MDWRWLAWQIVDGELWRPCASAYDSLLASQWLSRGEVEERQHEQLAALLSYASREIPYYRKLGLPPRLDPWPVLSRRTLREQGAALMPSSDSPGRSYLWETSGSSGEPVRIYCDVETQALRRAALLRGDLWGSGLAPTDAQAGLWATRRDSGKLTKLRGRLYDTLWNRYVFSCFQMDRTRALELNSSFASCRARLLYGPTTALIAFRHFAQQAGLTPWRFEKVIPAGEQCSLETQQALSDFFGCLVQDRYASNEFGPIASRCEHNTWHAHSESVLLEVRRPDGSIGRSGSGSLLITSLSNRAMPLIRYELGDRADLSPVECPCGRGLQTFSALEGRVSEILACPDGQWLNLATFNSFLQHLPLEKFRLLIEPPGKVILLLQSAAPLDPTLVQSTCSHLQTFLAGRFEFELRQVDSIPTLPSGKNPYVINRLSLPD